MKNRYISTLIIFISFFFVACSDIVNEEITSHFEDGRFEKTIEYKDGSVKVKVYYPSGQVQSEIGVLNRKNHGSCKLYDKDGNLISKFNYVNGIKEGKATNYYSSGEIKDEGYVKNGEYEGEIIEYYEDGKVKATYIIQDGKRHGIEKTYYSNGNLKSKGEFINGLRTDIDTLFYESGELFQKIYFSAVDKRDITNRVIEYDKEGNIIKDDKLLNFETTSDTVNFGEEFYLEIKLLRWEHDSIDILLADFNQKYEIQDSSSLKTFYGKNHHLKVPITLTNKGWNRYRMIVRDHTGKQEKIVDGEKILQRIDYHHFVFYDFYVR